MSHSNRDSGVLGVMLALGLLVLVAAGLFLYQRTRTLQAAMAAEQHAALAAEQRAALAAEQRAALAARDESARQRTESAVSFLMQVPPVFYEDTVFEKDASLVQAEIVSKLAAQQTDWNNGDLDAFMKVYWNSERLTFASGGKVTRGYQATLDGYKAKYSTKEKMGKLTFDGLEFQRLADQVMLVLGTWHLERGDDSVGGNFSLVWKKFDEQWLIVHDHTSALPIKN